MTSDLKTPRVCSSDEPAGSDQRTLFTHAGQPRPKRLKRSLGNQQGEKRVLPARTRVVWHTASTRTTRAREDASTRGAPRLPPEGPSPLSILLLALVGRAGCAGIVGSYPVTASQGKRTLTLRDRLDAVCARLWTRPRVRLRERSAAQGRSGALGLSVRLLGVRGPWRQNQQPEQQRPGHTALSLSLSFLTCTLPPTQSESACAVRVSVLSERARKERE